VLTKQVKYKASNVTNARTADVNLCPRGKKGRSVNTKIVALFLYISGLSLRRIARIVKTDVHAVYRWIWDYSRTNYEKLSLRGEAVELDEMWHYLHSKKQKFGRLIVGIPVNLSTGNVEEAR
jgi:hypothetical protein